METYYLECADCGYRTEENDFIINCPRCDGFIEVQIPEDIPRELDPDQESIFRFHHLMPFDVSPRELLDKEDIESTPVVRSETVAEEFDIDLYYKDETVFPTGTFKDREGFVSLHRLWLNDIKNMVLFSSGNTGTSLSRSASKFQGPKLHLIVPRASKQRIEQGDISRFFDHEYIDVHYHEGSNDECDEFVEQFAREHGYPAEGGFRNYARREGLKLFGLEYFFDMDEEVDWYVQPVAGGIGIYSFWKAHQDLKEACPRILGVQADLCSPMVNAWKDGSDTLESKHVPDEIVPSEFVRVLRTRKPFGSYPIVKNVMDRVNGAFKAVSDSEIYEALRWFYTEDYFRDRYSDGTKVGLEPATALAGILKAVREGDIKAGEKILLNVSGAAKSGDVKDEWIEDLINENVTTVDDSSPLV
jgi:threonine synthase